MVREELYIIKGGERMMLNLPQPSGITLNYVSNLFNDLSKINASYSYTFQLPRTANNCRVLDVVDDVRADSKFTKASSDVEFEYDGVILFRNANLYINGVEDDHINAVLTWNVNEGLKKLNDMDMSLRELGKFLTDDEADYVGDKLSEYEKDIVYRWEGAASMNVLKNEKGVPYTFGKPETYEYTPFRFYDPYQPIFRPVNNAGTPFIATTIDPNDPKAEANNGEFPLHYFGNYHWDNILTDEKGSERIGWDFFRVRTSNNGTKDNREITIPCPPPIVPVPYLVKMIERAFDMTFDFGGDFYESLCVPLSCTAASEAYCRTSRVEFTFKGTKYDDGDADRYVFSAKAFNDYPYALSIQVYGQNTESVSSSFGGGTGSSRFSIGYNPPEAVEGKKRTFSNPDKIRFGGVFCMQAKDLTVGSDDEMPRIIMNGLSGEDELLEAYSEGYRTIEIEGQKVTGYVFDFRYEAGFKPKLTDKSFTIFNFEFKQGDTKIDVTDIKGKITLVPASEGNTKRAINLFANLPDISCSEFLKSMFYILGGFPFEDMEGNIKLQKYSEILEHIRKSDVYDWSNRIVNTVNSYTENINFDLNDATSLDLAQTNYFLMKNDQVDDLGKEAENDPTEDAYIHGYAKILIDNKMLDKVHTIYTFPFSGGFLWHEGGFGGVDSDLWVSDWLDGEYRNYFSEGFTGRTQDKWQITERDYKHGGVPVFEAKEETEPLLGVIKKSKVLVTYDEFELDETQDGTRIVVEAKDYYPDWSDYMLSYRAWNCKDDMLDSGMYDVLKGILQDPCLVKEELVLNAMDLATLDVTKPVYLEKYNSYFAIKNIEVSSEGTSTAELLRIPSSLL